MSCRRFLALVKNLPEDSALCGALRDDEWPSVVQLVAAAVNEMRLSRADQAAMHGQDMGAPELILSPAQLRRADEERQPAKDAHAHVSSRLRGEISWKARQGDGP